MEKVIYKIQTDDDDFYTQDLEVAKGVYQLGEETGQDCRIWEQVWVDDIFEPIRENVIASTDEI